MIARLPAAAPFLKPVVNPQNPPPPTNADSASSWPTPGDDELLSAYVDGELSEQQVAEVERRLESDAAARRLVDELRAISSVVRQLPANSAPAGLAAGVAQRLNAEATASTEPKSAPSGWSFGRSPRSWAWAGLAVAAALLVMVFDPTEQAHEADIALVKAPVPAAEMRAELPEVRNNLTQKPPLVLRAPASAAVRDELEERFDDIEPSARLAHQPSSRNGAIAARELEAELAVDPSAAPTTALPAAESDADRGIAATDSAMLRSDPLPSEAAPGAMAGINNESIDPARNLALLPQQIVVEVGLRGETLPKKSIDKLLLSNSITVSTQAPDDLATFDSLFVNAGSNQTANRFIRDGQAQIASDRFGDSFGGGGFGGGGAKLGKSKSAPSKAAQEETNNRAASGKSAFGLAPTDASEQEQLDVLLIEAPANQVATFLSQLADDTDNTRTLACENLLKQMPLDSLQRFKQQPKSLDRGYFQRLQKELSASQARRLRDESRPATADYFEAQQANTRQTGKPQGESLPQGRAYRLDFADLAKQSAIANRRNQAQSSRATEPSTEREEQDADFDKIQALFFFRCAE